ncbi:MAG: thiamine phosphate synthase, partial [Vicinamibacteria bacterium]
MTETPSSSQPPFSRLYPILDASLETKDSMAASIRTLARAGCRLVQLRAKELSAREFLSWAETAREASSESGIRLVINDRVDVALLVGADGVHLGQDDISPESARKILGPGAIVGLSTHSLEEAGSSTRAPVDYVAIGPIFETSTKLGGPDPIGIEGALAVRAVVRRPLVAIGGITLERAPALFEAGIDGLAVISALKEPFGEGQTLESI